MDLAEHAVPDLVAQSETAGYRLILGETCSMGRNASSTLGRRVALLIHNDTPCEDITKAGDQYTDFLKDTGRWVERLIPLENGKQMIVASVYGYSGASAVADDFVANERLLAAAIMRLKAMQNMP